jgi:hypothetical protein
MRQTIRTATQVRQRDGNAVFALGAIVSAAIVVALFTLHGGPDLLAGKLPTFATVALDSP